MDIASVQVPLLIGALLFSCSALLRVHIVQRVTGSAIVPGTWAGAGPGELAVLAGIPLDGSSLLANPTTSPAPRPSRPSKTRTTPFDWAEQDDKVRQVVAMTTVTGAAYRSHETCACGGEWRYDLCRRSSELWRCLHCGGLYSGHELVPED